MNEGLLDFVNSIVGVSTQEFEELVSKLELRHYGKKSILTSTGETERHLYFIQSGLIRKFFRRGNTEVITHLLKEGGIACCTSSFLTGKPSKYTLETLEPTTALVISKENLEDLYRSGKKWERFGRLITTHFFLMKEHHILDNIRLSTRERFKKFMKENPDLVQRVPQKYLASYLDIKPETFSRLKHLLYK